MNKRILTYFLLIIVLLMSPGSLKGSHIVGGEFTLTHLQNELYELKFEVYRDCFHGVPYFNEPLYVGMFEKSTHNQVDDFVMYLESDDTLNFVADGCIDIPLNCTHVGRYQKIIRLNENILTSDHGYYFSWERCCRNVDIDNIRLTDPTQPNGSEGIAFYMSIPSLDKKPSTPEFNRGPMTLLCVDNSFSFDFSATDPDGDSIVYSLIEPVKGNLTPKTHNDTSHSQYPIILSGPYDPIVWNDGYSLSNIMDSDPPMDIDRHTGEVHITPRRQGIYAVAIEAEYFRNGERLGRVIREMQFHVTSCEDNNPPTFTETDISKDTVYEVIATDELYLKFDVTDPNRGDSVYVHFESSLFDDPEIASEDLSAPKTSGFEDASTHFRWRPTCSHVSDKPYELTIVAEDDGCPQPMRTIEHIKVRVLPVPEVSTPQVVCMERMNEHTKIINWSAYKDYHKYKDYLKNFKLIKKFANGEEEVLKSFSDTLVNTFIDQNAPIANTDDECYTFIAENVCGDIVKLHYSICREEDIKELSTIQLRNATVKDNEHVRIFWNKTDDKPFDSYMIYRKERHSDGPFQLYTIVEDINDTMFTDKNTNVDKTSYCYRIETRNACGFNSEMGQRGCQIVLDGSTRTFEHLLNWTDYAYWPKGVESYKLQRRFLENKPITIATKEPGEPLKWYDDALENDEGAYYYEIVAFEESDGLPVQSHSNEIYLYQKPLFHAPNVFSPNDDDINDTWVYKTVFVRELHLQIYTRWGELVYETYDIKGSWDGKIGGVLSEETVFVYQVNYRGWDNSNHFQKGTITILR